MTVESEYLANSKKKLFSTLGTVDIPWIRCFYGHSFFEYLPKVSLEDLLKFIDGGSNFSELTLHS